MFFLPLLGLAVLGFVETLFLFFLPSILAEEEATGFLNLVKSIFSEDTIVGPSNFLAFARITEAPSVVFSSRAGITILS